MVESRQEIFCMPHSGGMIFAGLKPRLPQRDGCHQTANLAWIRSAHIPAGIRHRKPTKVINGIGVYRLPNGAGAARYLVPDLGVVVGVRGPLAARVLATLSRSPLAAVLRPGRAAPAPAGWTWRQFGGVRFATPRPWPRQRKDQWASCGTGLWPGDLLLIDATKPPLALPCPFPIPSAAGLRAEPGLTVVTGKYAAQSVGEHFTRCRNRHGARICLSSDTGTGGLYGGVLIFSVTRPHQHHATYFILGLTGTGARARAVFDSVRLA
jgi:hypothetical protein